MISLLHVNQLWATSSRVGEAHGFQDFADFQRPGRFDPTEESRGSIRNEECSRDGDGRTEGRSMGMH